MFWVFNATACRLGKRLLCQIEDCTKQSQTDNQFRRSEEEVVLYQGKEGVIFGQNATARFFANSHRYSNGSLLIDIRAMYVN